VRWWWVRGRGREEGDDGWMEIVYTANSICERTVVLGGRGLPG
jgi:hypothetical protein